MPRSAKIGFVPSEEDRTWLKAQGEALGLEDPALVLGMLVRYARKNGLDFTLVTTGQRAPVTVPTVWQPQTIPPQQVAESFRQEHAAMNEPAPDFEFGQGPETIAQPTPDEADEVGAALADGISALDAMMAPEPKVVSLPTPSHRSRSASFRGSTSLNRPAFDGKPGSFTQPVGLGDIPDPRSLTGQQSVQRQNFKHFFGGR